MTMTAAEIEQALPDLEAQVSEVVAMQGDAQRRTRRAIEIHGKLEQCATSLAELRRQPGGRDNAALEPLRNTILALTRTLLQDVFTIENAPGAPAPRTVILNDAVVTAALETCLGIGMRDVNGDVITAQDVAAFIRDQHQQQR